MKRYVVENRPDLIALKRIKDPLTVDSRRQENVVHVGIVLTVIWNNRSPQYSLGFQRFQKLMITLPASQPLFSYSIRFFKLRPKESGNQIPWQER